MFSPEQLWSKTGPLAHVWLAVNHERKLSKSQVLHSNIQKSIDAIVDHGVMPVALRLSSQLLLGVAHIYGRKAGLLRDDCHEALLKLQAAFKTSAGLGTPAGPAISGHVTPSDLLTMDDLFPAMNFAHSPIPQPTVVAYNEAAGVDWTLTLEPLKAKDPKPHPEDPVLVIDEDLGLDFGDGDDFEGDDFDGDDFDVNDPAISSPPARTVSAERALDEAVMLGEEQPSSLKQIVDNDDDFFGEEAVSESLEMRSLSGKHDGTPPRDDEQQFTPLAESMELECGSPLSKAVSADVHNLVPASVQSDDEVPEATAQWCQRNKRLKSMIPDSETVLSMRQLKQFSEDRSKILSKPLSLHHTSRMLTLMDMEKNGDFVANAMNDGVSRNWAPELQGLLSFESVHQCCQKRKRAGGSSVMSEEEHVTWSSPSYLEHEADESSDIGDRPHQSLWDTAPDDDVQSPADDSPALGDTMYGQNDEEISRVLDNFDDTMMSTVDPADDLAVPLDMESVVQLLREKLGDHSSDETSTSQMQESVLLQELVPERKTRKEDATKFFFEVLVLATKDVIRVDQGNGEIGLPLRIKGKQVPCDSWAEASL